MAFDFSSKLSSSAQGVVPRWTGYPPYHFVGGNIDEPSVPVDELAEIVAGVIRREGHAMAKYGMNSGPQGNLKLRQFISENLARRTEINVTTGEVLVTSGSLQALDLVNAAFLESGDAVVLEAANYAGAVVRLRRLGVEPVPVKLDAGGMCMDDLRTTLSRLRDDGVRCKFIYTIPTVQNPTGSVMSSERRCEMLSVAREFDTAIFEDDCYADLLWEGQRPPAIYSLDEDQRTVYCGTFSKTIAPALRVGYLVAPWQLMRHILPLKTDAGSGALEQLALAEYLPLNFDRHVDEVLPVLRGKSRAMVDALNEQFGASAEFTTPVGGIFVWVTLPEEVDTTRLAVLAGDAGVAINPGAEWTVDGEKNRHRMRLCFGHARIEDIREGVARLATICHQEFGVPLRGGNIDR